MLTELAAAIAWENHQGRLNQVLGVRPSGFSDGAVCLLGVWTTIILRQSS